jgi:hypothetical protein
MHVRIGKGKKPNKLKKERERDKNEMRFFFLLSSSTHDLDQQNTGDQAKELDQ